MAAVAKVTLLGYGLPLPGAVAEFGEDAERGMAFTSSCCSTAATLGARNSSEMGHSPPSRMASNVSGVPSPCRAFRKLSTSMMTAGTSRSHVDRWRDRDETVIIFDWDDTLCPTTAGSGADLELLQRHAEVVERTLRAACALGHVEIVTMAARSWVESTTRSLVPGIGPVIEELDIPISYAREGVSARCRRESCMEGRDPSQYLKQKTISKVLRGFYRTVKRRSSDPSRPRGRSWKNVLSIGDSTAERFAVQDVVLGRVQRDRRGRWKECRCKVVKMKTEPTVEELTFQLLRLTDLLTALVQHDNDLDACLEDEDALLEKLELTV